ncbi:MAG: hypothetical protein ABI833_13485 [Acidobacteriota bacterium]
MKFFPSRVSLPVKKPKAKHHSSKIEEIADLVLRAVILAIVLKISFDLNNVLRHVWVAARISNMPC